jgi:pimeloyl-ACP methyl ester carboxylesterase
VKLRRSDLQGLGRLAIGATLGITDLVEQMHSTIAAAPLPLEGHTPRKARGIAGLVYGSVRGITRLVGGTLEAVLGPFEASTGEALSSFEREAALAIANGVLGDFLEKSGNPLAIRMSFRQGGQPLKLSSAAQPTGKILLLVHGLCRNDLQWSPETVEGEEGPIAKLGRKLGYTPVALHYNSGLPIADNGRRLAELLEGLVGQWPVRLEELAIVGHSMGGLVARCACRHAETAGLAWLPRLRRAIFLGTPHRGAPLERGGHAFEQLLGQSPYSAPFTRLGRIRSAGITDLRHGLVDASLPAGVAAFAIAGTLAKDENDLAGGLLGDGLVPVASALGLDLPPENQWIAYGTGHLRLVASPAVCEKLEAWLAPVTKDCGSAPGLGLAATANPYCLEGPEGRPDVSPGWRSRDAVARPKPWVSSPGISGLKGREIGDESRPGLCEILQIHLAS